MTPLDRLNAVLAGLESAAVAVSGGIDSLTLATAAHRAMGARVSMHHATSPAVPGEATERTRRLAAAEGWALDVFDAGEFADPAYRANPVNRCFFCKTNLYGAVARRTTRTILSGTNLDDLGDFRPGLQAARDHGVRHPFVEAAIDKATVRAVALEQGMGALSELPSAPCLSSRVETGIRIEAPVLAMVHAAETLVAASVAARAVRCRVRADAVVVELDQASLDTLDPSEMARLSGHVMALARDAGLAVPVRFAPYRMGSAFLRTPA
jgi:uncharacterized protein